MDKGTLIMATKDADGLESHLSKPACPSRISTKDGNQGANTNPVYKANAEKKCEDTASCASSHDMEDGPAPKTKRKVTPAEAVTETSNTNVSNRLSDGADRSKPKISAKRAKVVKKGIAQVVKKKQKKGGWEYVEESDMVQDIGKRRK